MELRQTDPRLRQSQCLVTDLQIFALKTRCIEYSHWLTYVSVEQPRQHVDLCSNLNKQEEMNFNHMCVTQLCREVS